MFYTEFQMRGCLPALYSIVLISAVSRAEVMQFTDKHAWELAVAEDYLTIDFTGFPHNTFITDQYIDLGATFAGVHLITGPTPAFPNDSWGLFGPSGVRVKFDSPQNGIGIDHPGYAQFQLFSNGVLLYTSSLFPGGGVGHFSGLISSTGFDEAYIFKPPPLDNQVFIDDLHWGSAVPAPGAAGLILAFMLGRRRRRTSWRPETRRTRTTTTAGWSGI